MNITQLKMNNRYFLLIFASLCLLNTMTYTNNEGSVKSITEWAKAQWKKPVVRYATYGIITIILGVCLINKILIDLHKGPCTTPFDDRFPSSYTQITQPVTQSDREDILKKISREVREYDERRKRGEPEPVGKPIVLEYKSKRTKSCWT